MFDVSSPILGCFFTTIFDVSTTFDPKKNSMFRTAFEAFCNGETKASTATPMSFPSTVSPWPPKNVSVRPPRTAPRSPARSNWRSPDGATEICRNRWSVWCVIMMRCLFCLFIGLLIYVIYLFMCLVIYSFIYSFFFMHLHIYLSIHLCV